VTSIEKSVQICSFVSPVSLQNTKVKQLGETVFTLIL